MAEPNRLTSESCVIAAFLAMAVLFTLTLSPPALAANPQFLKTNEYLTTGKYLVSETKDFFAIMQSDGNFCVYRGSGPENNLGPLYCMQKKPLPTDEYFAIMQGDGNFCVYRGTDPGNNKGYVGCALDKAQKNDNYFSIMQDDGNFVVYNGTDPGHNKGFVWSTERVAHVSQPSKDAVYQTLRRLNRKDSKALEETKPFLDRIPTTVYFSPYTAHEVSSQCEMSLPLPWKFGACWKWKRACFEAENLSNTPQVITGTKNRNNGMLGWWLLQPGEKVKYKVVGYNTVTCPTCPSQGKYTYKQRGKSYTFMWGNEMFSYQESTNDGSCPDNLGLAESPD